MSDSIFSYKTLCHAIAGSCGSVSAMTMALPLDTARTRLVLDDSRKAQNTIQTLLDLIKEEGIISLFRGGASTLQSVAVSNFVYFYTFHGLKKLVGVKGKQSATKDLVFACIAGTINVLMTNPLWVVNLRLKMQGVDKKEKLKKSYNGLLDGLLRIAQDEGISKLWSGTASSLVLVSLSTTLICLFAIKFDRFTNAYIFLNKHQVSNPAIKFTVYEWLKRLIASYQSEEKNLSAFKAFLLGALSSSIATTITYPIQVVQTKSRFQNQEDRKASSRKTPKGMLEMTLYLHKNFGASIFFKGLEAKLIQSIVTAGFMFLAYEKILFLTQKAMGIKTG